MASDGRRSLLSTVALPTEHGGWGLTLEPGLLGLLVAPGLAALSLGLAALLAFFVRTPLRLAILGRRSGRLPDRTTLATWVVVGEIGLILALVAVAAVSAQDAAWWLPAVVAVPLLLVAFAYDLRASSRSLVPEVAGAVAIAGVTAMSALAGGLGWPVALGLWAILGARVLSSIPFVRNEIDRLHGRETSAMEAAVGDGAAILVAIGAAAVDVSLLPAALAVIGLIVVQRYWSGRPSVRAKVLGVRQMIVGFTVVGVTAVGVWLI
jgi:hypothetical protein